MAIISLSDREVIDHLGGDSLIEKVPADKKQEEPFQPKKCCSLSPEWCNPPTLGPSPKGGGSQYIFIIADKEPDSFKVWKHTPHCAKEPIKASVTHKLPYSSFLY